MILVPAERRILACVGCLLALGVVMVLSSSAVIAQERFGSALYFLRKHLVWLLLGLGALLIFRQVDYRRLIPAGSPLLLLSLILLATTLFVGEAVGGARRWLRVGPLSFQPSELAKWACILYLAGFLAGHRSRLHRLNTLLKPLFWIACCLGLIAVEPDLGTPILLAAVAFACLFIGGVRLRHLAVPILAAILAVAALIAAKPYRIQRIRAFLDPASDSRGAGYQTTQSLVAMASGGFTGVGPGEGRSKLFFLPEVHTDFIFPLIGEEFGFLGAGAVIVLFWFLTWLGLRVSRDAPDEFGTILAAGISLMIGLQAGVNIAMSIGLLPTKGMPLPFLSVGGTNLVMTCAAAGVLLNISRHLSRRSLT